MLFARGKGAKKGPDKATPPIPGLGKPKKVNLKGFTDDQLDMTVENYRGKYLEGSVKSVLGSQYDKMTVKQALQTGSTTLRKILLQYKK